MTVYSRPPPVSLVALISQVASPTTQSVVHQRVIYRPVRVTSRHAARGIFSFQMRLPWIGHPVAASGLYEAGFLWPSLTLSRLTQSCQFSNAAGRSCPGFAVVLPGHRNSPVTLSAG